jgi:hypothetical protein
MTFLSRAPVELFLITILWGGLSPPVEFLVSVVAVDTIVSSVLVEFQNKC